MSESWDSDIPFAGFIPFAGVIPRLQTKWEIRYSRYADHWWVGYVTRDQIGIMSVHPQWYFPSWEECYEWLCTVLSESQSEDE